jgi:hypothetical protein
MSDFGTALRKLWPNGDEKIPGLRAGMIASAPEVFAKYGVTSPLLVAHVMAQGSHECGAGLDMLGHLAQIAHVRGAFKPIGTRLCVAGRSRKRTGRQMWALSAVSEVGHKRHLRE